MIDKRKYLRIPVSVPMHGNLKFAAEIREHAGVLTGAVGLITEADHAESILANGEADAIFIGRELLRNPYWPLYAKAQLDSNAKWPVQYERSADNGTYRGPTT